MNKDLKKVILYHHGSYQITTFEEYPAIKAGLVSDGEIISCEKLNGRVEGCAENYERSENSETNIENTRWENYETILLEGAEIETTIAAITLALAAIAI